ncbi:MAG: AMP-binding protein, partial [Vicinamibacterales bacterium]
EGYGLTETAPVLTVNPEGRQKLGTVGTAIPQVTLRIADDGEILARGPNITIGYYRKQSETDEAIQDGWFHTGDIGFLDEEGYLTITDRKKELIITASGKNIAPNPIEASLKRSPLVSEAMLVGDRRPYIVALLIADLDALRLRVPTAGAEDASLDDIVNMPHVLQLFGDIVEAVNERLPRHEQIKRWAILPAEFSITTGELTPTLKLKRRVVVERWSSVIDELYI